MGQDSPMICLFNYGGGLRGLIPAHIMARIEHITGLRMADMVDFFTGPSTGAILNAALTLRHPDHRNRPQYRARHLVRFYEREGANIFPHDRFRDFRGLIHDFNNRTMRLRQLNTIFRHGHYDPANLSKALKALYGDAQLKDSLKSLVIPCYNIDGEQLEVVEEEDEGDDAPVHTKNNVSDEGGHAVWFKNILTKTPRGVSRKTARVKLHDAVQASCAAPTYYPCHHFPTTWPETGETSEYAAIDGSIFDNPCISYLGAIRQHVPEGRKLIMIGLGTGYTNRSYKKEDWNRYGSLGVVDPVNDFPLINIFFHASESALLETFGNEMGHDLYIFNKSLVADPQDDWPSPQIDDAAPENLKKMKNFAEVIIEENQKSFDHVCDLLVRNRDNNQITARDKAKEWKRKLYFFTGKPRDKD